MLKKIELEITSDCNAACPGCARTLHPEKYKVTGFSTSMLKNLFPMKEHIIDKKFKFCGVLGDPAKNEDMVDMIDYLTENGAHCEVSTNGGIQSADWWRKLGKIAGNRPGSVHIHWCIDGHKETNHIYRVNTVFKIIDRNMQAFAENAAPGSAKWIYIVFDHNEHELDAAKEHAHKLGFGFATRTGMRNSYHDWVAQIKKRDVKTKKIVTENKSITTTGTKEHSKKKQVAELDSFIAQYQKEKIPQDQISNITDTIECKFYHEGEIFIASDLTLWPCCFLWDSALKNKDGINDKLSKYDTNWNDLKKFSIQEVLNHPWYEEVLAMSWNPYHEKHLTRCIRTCAKNKAYHNEINDIQ